MSEVRAVESAYAVLAIVATTVVASLLIFIISQGMLRIG